MANWEDNQLHRTLYIRREGSPGSYKYQIHDFFRVRTMEGQSYLEPLPVQQQVGLAHMGIVFDRVEIIDPPSSNQDGALNLTKSNSNGILRLTSDDRA